MDTNSLILPPEFLIQIKDLNVCFCVEYYEQFRDCCDFMKEHTETIGKRNGAWVYCGKVPTTEDIYDLIILLPNWRGDIQEFYKKYPDFCEV